MHALVSAGGRVSAHSGSPAAGSVPTFGHELFGATFLQRFQTRRSLYPNVGSDPGSAVYWIFGAVLALAGYGVVELNAPVALGAFAGTVIEAVFAGLLLAGARREAGMQSASA